MERFEGYTEVSVGLYVKDEHTVSTKSIPEICEELLDLAGLNDKQRELLEKLSDGSNTFR